VAKFSDVNSIMNTTTLMEGGQFFFRLKTVLKAAGWTVPASSDGTTYSSTGDVITRYDTGTGGLQNPSAWYIVREPGGRREHCIQHVGASTTMLYRCKYSALARFTGGSPGITRVPSATDEQVLAGSGTDAAPVGGSFFNNSIVHRIHIIANSTPISGCYPFVAFVTLSPGIAEQSGCYVQEPMAPGSFDPTDGDPCILKLGLGGQSISTMFSSASGWFAYGTANQTWSTTISGSNSTFNGSLAQDLVSGRDVNGRPLYVASITGTRIKGYGSTIAVKGPARTYPTTANRATDAYVYLSNMVIPYPDNTEPGV
jgi:hypothetical protein